MLYFKDYITDTTLLAVWKIEESQEELLSILQHHEWVQYIYSIKSETRILEILTARILIKDLTGEEKEVYYNNSGKPLLTDKSFQISVSHTKGYVAVAINKKKTIGLDIERISEKIKRVQTRIISNDEYIDSDNELIHLLLHWSAKEAMFKFLDTEGVDFLRHLLVDKFTPKKVGKFSTSEKRTPNKYNFKASYKVENDFVIVCLEA